MTPAERAQLNRIERKTNLALVGVGVAVVLCAILSAKVVFGVSPADILAAQADQAKLPRELTPFTYYVSTSAYPADLQDEARAALFYAVAMSSSQQIAERCVPQPVSATLFRLDLIQLQWDWREWHRVLAKYPYRVGTSVSPVSRARLPLVVDAGWLVVQLSDTTESNAHYRLLYRNADVTRNEFLAFWGVNRKARSSFGIITRSENPLGPSVAGIRQIDNYPTDERGSAWGTRDSAKIDDETDPLQHLDGGFKHDAEEWLVAAPKISGRTGVRGFLLAALLSDGQGERVEEAPPSIVTDRLGFRGQHAIRNWGSCVACHASGINPPSNNRVRQIIQQGVEIYAKKGVQEQIEIFHLSDSGKQITRDNEDFAAGVLMVTGMECEQFAAAFRASVNHYDAAVTLEQAAREFGVSSTSLKVTLGLASFYGYDLGARGAALAANDPCPRSAWEGGVYRRVAGAVEAYGR